MGEHDTNAMIGCTGVLLGLAGASVIAYTLITIWPPLAYIAGGVALVLIGAFMCVAAINN